MTNKINLKYYGIAFVGIIFILIVYFMNVVKDIGESELWPITEYNEIKFDKELWLNDKEQRFTMTKDLIGSGILIGKDLREIMELLGSEYNSYSEHTISYYLGFIPSVGNLDPDVLELTFENEKVIKVRQHGT